MSTRYRAEVTAIGGRTGRVLSADGALRLALAPPTAAGCPAANPEQLLAAGYAASFLEAIFDAARSRGILLAHDSNVTAAVERKAKDVHLDIVLTIDLPSVTPTVARQLVDEARLSCPFSVALRDHVEVTVTFG